jgi:predicted  nucleic acid-binding Zn-ribbon protein
MRYLFLAGVFLQACLTVAQEGSTAAATPPPHPPPPQECPACPTCEVCPKDLSADLSACSAESAKISADASACTASSTQLKADLTAVGSDLSSAKADLSAAVAKIQTASAETAACVSDLQIKATEASNKATEASKFSAEAQACADSLAASSATSATCAADLAAKTSAHDALSSSTSLCTAKLTSTETDLSQLKAKSDKCVEDLSTIQGTLDSASASTGAQVEGLQKQLDDVRKKQMLAEEDFNKCTVDGRKLTSDKEHLETKVEAVKADLNEELKKVQEKLLKKEAEVDGLNDRIKKLNAEITESKKIYDSAIKRGTGIKKYCNFTLMGEDAEIQYNATRDEIHKTYTKVSKEAKVKADLAIVATKTFSVEAREKSKSVYAEGVAFGSQTYDSAVVYYGIASEVVQDGVAQGTELASPYVEIARARTTELYDEHLKEHVDAKVKPVYEEFVAPHVATVKKVTKETYAEAVPLCKDLLSKSKTNAKHLKLSAVLVVQAAAVIVREKLPDGGSGEIENWIKFVETDAEYCVDCILWAIAAWLTYLFGFRLLKLAIRVALLPARLAVKIVIFPIVVIVFPFTYVAGKVGGASKEEDEEKKKTEEEEKKKKNKGNSAAGAKKAQAQAQSVPEEKKSK